MVPLCHGLLAVVGLTVFAAAPGLLPSALPVRIVHTFKVDEGIEPFFSFSADGRRLVASGNKAVYLWDTVTGKELAQFSFKGKGAGLVTLSPDGRTVASSSSVLWQIILLDADSGQVQHRLSYDHSVWGLMFAPDGKSLIVAESDAVRLWDVATGKELRKMRLRDPATSKEWVPGQHRELTREKEIWGVLFTPDGRLVAVGTRDGSIHLCDPATGVETGRLFHEDDLNAIECMAFSPDGRFLAVGGWRLDTVARLWDVRTGKAVRAFELPVNPPEGFERDEYIPWKYRNPLSGKSILLKAPAGTWALAFSPDGKTLAASALKSSLTADSGDKTYFFEVATGRVRLELPITRNRFMFAPNGIFATTGNNWSGPLLLLDLRDQ